MYTLERDVRIVEFVKKWVSLRLGVVKYLLQAIPLFVRSYVDEQIANLGQDKADDDELE